MPQQTAAIGYAVLVTWPEFQRRRHVQHTWYAYHGDQTEAVKAVQDACGALNDAKVEILGPVSKATLERNGLSPGSVAQVP